MNTENDMQILCDDEALKCWFHRGSGNRLVLSFSGIGQDPEQPQVPEFVHSARGNDDYSVLYFADAQRSWLNNGDIIERIVGIVNRTKEEINVDAVCAIGHSMGGYCAIVISHFIDIEAVFATSLQMSIDPKIAPREGRWMNFRSRIKEIKIRNVVDYMNQKTTYFLITGDHKRERSHRELIPRQRNVFTYILPNVAHQSQKRLKGHGIFFEVVQAAIQNRPRKLRMLMERTNAKLYNGRRVIEGRNQRKTDAVKRA